MYQQHQRHALALEIESIILHSYTFYNTEQSIKKVTIELCHEVQIKLSTSIKQENKEKHRIF